MTTRYSASTKQSLRALWCGLMFLAGGPAFAACSSYLGKVVFNELQDPSSGTTYLELRILDPNVIANTSSFSTWKVDVYKNNVSTKFSASLNPVFTDATKNNCGTNSAWIRIPDASLNNTIAGSNGVNSLNFVLYESTSGGQIVDVFRWGSASSFYGAGSNYTSCPTIESALPSAKYDSAWISNGYKDWYRTPDGTGNWGNGQTANNVNSICSSNDGNAASQIGLSKVASAATVTVNTNFTFTLFAQNGATGTAQSNVVVTDNLTTAGLTFVSCTPTAPDTCTYSAATGLLTWTVGTATNPFALNTTKSATLTVSASTVGTKTNTIVSNTAGNPSATTTVTIIGPDHIRLNHTGSGATCTGSSVTVNACSSADVGGSCTAYTSGVSGNVVAKNGATVVATVPFTIAAGSSSAAITVPVTAAQTVTLETSSLSVATVVSPAWTCWDGSSTSCSLTFASTSCVSGYECQETGTTYNNPPMSTNRNPLYTKLSGTPFTFDVIALQSSGAVASSYTATGNVTVELFDDSASPTPACSAYASPLASKAVTFASGDNGRKSVGPTFTLPNAYRKVRCRVTDTNLTPTVYGCSSDDFSVRPSAVSLVTAASATAPSSTATPTIKAGANFALQATTSTGTNYAGTLTLDTTTTPASAVKLTAQTTTQDSTQAPLGVVGTLSPTTLVGNAAAVSATYSEVGYLYLAPGAYRDNAFTAVDSAVDDCVTSTTSDANLSDVVNGSGKYGCSIGNKTTVSLGRFVPDHFDTTVTGTMTCAASAGTASVTSASTAVTGVGTSFLSDISPGNTIQIISGVEYLVSAVPSTASLTLVNVYSGATASGLTVVPCPIGGMAYSGQAFSVQVSAKNFAGGVTNTQNYAGVFAKNVTLSAVASKGGAVIATAAPGGTLTANTAAATSFVAGTNAASLAAPVFTFNTAPTLPTSVFVRAADPDSVNSLRSPASTSVEGGAKVVSGRVRMPNVYGSERLALPVTATVQYYNAATNWVTSLTDSASLFSLGTPVFIAGPMAAADLTITVLPDACASTVFCAGVKTISLNSANKAGSVNILFNAAPSYLSGVTTRATFGIFRSPLIYRRENY